MQKLIDKLLTIGIYLAARINDIKQKTQQDIM